MCGPHKVIRKPAQEAAFKLCRICHGGMPVKMFDVIGREDSSGI
jgi:hypothetical protein